MSTGRRVRWTDVAFFVFFAAYTGGALLVLVQGGLAVAASAWPSVHESFHVKGLGTGFTARISLRVAEASHSVPGGWQIALDYLFSLLNLALAGFVLWLRPRDRTARLLAVALVGSAGVFNLVAQRTYEALPHLALESVPQGFAHITAGLAYVYALLLFPDGRPVPRWRAPSLALLYLPFTAGAVLLALRAEGTARPAVLILFFGLLTPLAGVLAQAYRFRRPASPAQHQQARLLFWALLPALAVGVVFVFLFGTGAFRTAEFAGRHLPDQPVAVFRVFQPVFAIIPIALFAGLLRYRLWDIDRIINRTIVYGAATAALGAAYFGIVVLLQRITSAFTPESDVAVAASTLAVAAAFRPVLRWVQGFVDRRFYRRRYDAARTIERFSTRLRDEVDLDTLRAEMRSVVIRTMQPSHVTLWLRNAGSANGSGNGSGPDHGGQASDLPGGAVTLSVTVPGRAEDREGET